MPAFKRIDLLTKITAQTPTLLGALYERDIASGMEVMAVDEQESLVFAFSRYSKRAENRPFISSLKARQIARVVWSDDSFDEWRISAIDDGQFTDGLVAVRANPLIFDLASAADSSTGKGYVSELSNGIRVFDFSVGEYRAEDMWDTYIIPACPSWVAKGTIDPTEILPALDWDRQTPYALAILVRDALRAIGVTCELRLRRNGTSGYYLDLVTQIGASATVPLFHPNSSLQSLKRTYDDTQQATRVFTQGATDPGGTPGIPGRARWRVVSVNTGAKTVVVEDPNGGMGPIGFTNQWATPSNNYLIRVKTGRAFTITASDPDTQTFTLSETPTMVAGEWLEIQLTNPGTNTRTTTTRYAVSAVGGSTLTLSGDPITTDNTYVDWYARVWSAAVAGTIILTTRISASTAASDVITVASVAGVNNTHYVEFIQLDGAGEVPAYLDHPTYIQAPTTGYGVKVGDITIERAVGVTDLVTNPWMNTWTNGANPPDGWSGAAVGSSTLARNSNASFIRHGDYSYQFHVDHGNEVQITTPRIDTVWHPGNTRVSVRAWVYMTGFAVLAAHDYTLRLRLVSLNQAGTVNATLGTVEVYPFGYSTVPTGGVSPGTGVWFAMQIAGVTLDENDTPFGMAAILDNGGTAGFSVTCDGYLDTVEVYGFVANPESDYEFGDATVLHQAGNSHLDLYAQPLVAYDISVADLERLDPTQWSRNALTLGGNVRVFDNDFGVDATVRLLRRERDLKTPTRTRVGLANRPALLTSLVQTV